MVALIGTVAQWHSPEGSVSELSRPLLGYGEERKNGELGFANEASSSPLPKRETTPQNPLFLGHAGFVWFFVCGILHCNERKYQKILFYLMEKIHPSMPARHQILLSGKERKKRGEAQRSFPSPPLNDSPGGRIWCRGSGRILRAGVRILI